MPPRKRKHADDEEEEDSLEVENGVRGKRKAAVAARAKTVVTHVEDSEEEEDEGSNEDDDDDNDEDFEEEDEEDEDDEVDKSKEDGDAAEDDEENEEEDEDDDEDVDADAIKVECVEAVLDEPTKDVPGYELKSKEGDKIQKLEMWFSEEMSETVGDITEAFSNHYESNKLPVLQVTKFDVIEERDEIYQIDVLEAKYDKAYSIREKDDESDDESNLAQNLYCLVRVDGIDKTWATQYFMPEEDEE